MNTIKNILRYAVVLALGTAAFACKAPVQPYEPASPESGDRVYFISLPSGEQKLAKENPKLDIVIGRNPAEGALTANLVVTAPEAKDYFDIPSSVSFAAGEAKKTITLAVKDVEAIPMNSFYDVTMAIEESLVTLYGASSVSFSIGIELPWIKFSDGTMIEGWWGETEPDMVMYYQQIQPNIRYCKVDDCWGHDTGEGYPVQPYVWYWNTETNACYVPCQFMGYSSSGNDAYVSDEPAFYNWYWNSKEPGKNGSGLEQGTPEWFEWCDARRVAWEGDPFPYYDGAGRFYLGDWGFLVEPGTTNPTGSGFQFGGKQDMFVCSFAAEYTIGLVYNGILTRDEQVSVQATVTYETKDVQEVALVLVEGKDPMAAEEVMATECEQAIVISAAGTYNVPMYEGAASGKYTIVAIPLNGTGEPQWDYAEYETFQYVAPGGAEINPLEVIYSADDFVAGVSMEELLGIEWIGFGVELGDTGWADERTLLGPVTIADVEDNEEGDELFTISGLSAGAAEYFGFDDAILCDLYSGVIYTHHSENGSFDYQGTPLYVKTQWYDIAGDDVYDVDYALIGAYVEEGLIALVAYPNYVEKYGIEFGGLLYEAYTDPEYSDDGDLATIAGACAILLADSSKYGSAEAVAAPAKAFFSSNAVAKSIASLAKNAVSFQPKSEGGRVLGTKSAEGLRLMSIR